MNSSIVKLPRMIFSIVGSFGMAFSIKGLSVMVGILCFIVGLSGTIRFSMQLSRKAFSAIIVDTFDTDPSQVQLPLLLLPSWPSPSSPSPS